MKKTELLYSEQNWEIGKKGIAKTLQKICHRRVLHFEKSSLFTPCLTAQFFLLLSPQKARIKSKKVVDHLLVRQQPHACCTHNVEWRLFVLDFGYIGSSKGEQRLHIFISLLWSFCQCRDPYSRKELSLQSPLPRSNNLDIPDGFITEVQITVFLIPHLKYEQI